MLILEKCQYTYCKDNFLLKTKQNWRRETFPFLLVVIVYLKVCQTYEPDVLAVEEKVQVVEGIAFLKMSW